jgi:hypothetical protein
MKDFGEYIHSPFFNKNKSVSKLHSHIRKYHPELKDDKIEKEYTFKKIYNTSKYNDSLMRGTMFRLSKLAEDFIAYNQYKLNGIEEKKFLLTELRNRNVNRLFLKKFNEADSELENSGGISSDYVWNKLELNAIYYAYHNARASTDKRLDEIALYSCELLLTYFLLESKPLLGIVQNTMINIKSENEFNPLAEFFKNMQTETLLEKINTSSVKMKDVIKLNQNIINCILNINDEDSYQAAKKMLYGEMKIYSRGEVYNLFSSLIGNLLRKTMTSRDKYQDEYFELMTRSLESGAYSLYGEVMAVRVFDNIFTTALALNRTDWAEAFVKKYINYIVPSSRDNMLLYANARLAFQKGNYDAALEYSSKVKIEYFMQKIRLKITLMKIYYETKEYNAAISAIDTFRHFLKNSKNLTEERIINYDNFIKFLSQLIKYNLNPSSIRLAELKDKLAGTPTVAGKEWLLEKTEEAIKKFED